MKSLRSISPKGKKFLVRCDLDVLDDEGNIKEYFRLNSCLGTLNYILSHEGFAYICGHIGKTMETNPNFSTQKLNAFFEENLVTKNYELMENLRFDPREEANSLEFASELTGGKDYYVNESFATSHRNHSSIVLVPTLLPSFIGLHFEEELENLNYVLEANHKPLTVIIGGAKIESKKPTIDKFLEFADYILIGSKLSNEGSLKNNDKIILPKELIDGLDISQNDVDNFKKYIFESKTIFWSGPLGKVEDPKYAQGSLQVAELISKSGAYSVVGGGDTVSFLENYNLTHKFSFVSVGGSALLEYLSSKKLVGLEAVLKNNG